MSGLQRKDNPNSTGLLSLRFHFLTVRTRAPRSRLVAHNDQQLVIGIVSCSYLQVLSDYEHFVPLNLPVPDKIETIVNLAPRLMYDRPSPSSCTLSRMCCALRAPLTTITTGRRQKHFLVGMILQEIMAVLANTERTHRYMVRLLLRCAHMHGARVLTVNECSLLLFSFRASTCYVACWSIASTTLATRLAWPSSASPACSSPFSSAYAPGLSVILFTPAPPPWLTRLAFPARIACGERTRDRVPAHVRQPR